MVTYAPNTGAPIPEESDPYRVQADIFAAVTALDGQIGKLQTYIQENGGVRGAGISSITADAPGTFTIHWYDPDTAQESTQTVTLPELAETVSSEIDAVNANVSALRNGVLLANNDIAQLQAQVKDTGWVSMDHLVVAGNIRQPVLVRKVGSLVTWRGVIGVAGTWQAGYQNLLAGIPEEYRPPMETRVCCPISSPVPAYLAAEVDGRVRVRSDKPHRESFTFSPLSYYVD
ncbi:hypothetical protein ACUH93_00535 [Dermabacteraceae bacterium P7006]